MDVVSATITGGSRRRRGTVDNTEARLSKCLSDESYKPIGAVLIRGVRWI